MITNQFKKYIDSLCVFEDTPKIAVGISGGPDSIALLFLLHEYMQQTNGEVIALTVNHNLREESRLEAESIRAIIDFNITHHILDWKPLERKNSNIMHNARVARLDLLTNWCKENNVMHLFLGHHRDDLIETFFMRLLRGSGIEGLSSINPITYYNNTRIIRPLLEFKKEELKQYLVDKGVRWVEDPTNKNDKFTRTKIRNLLESKDFGDSDEGIVTSIDNIKRASQYVAKQVNKALVNCVEIYPAGYIKLLTKNFCALDEEIALNVLASCLMTISGDKVYKPRLDSLKHLYAAVLSGKLTAKTLWGCEIIAKNDHVVICREIPESIHCEKLNENLWIWDRRFLIHAKAPNVIKDIVPNTQKGKLLSKLAKSLPMIVMQDSTYVPFLTEKTNNLVNIYFYPTIPLAKKEFDY